MFYDLAATCMSALYAEQVTKKAESILLNYTHILCTVNSRPCPPSLSSSQHSLARTYYY